jgi:predicted RNA-binding Zn-ribbon protein involved in translation (DUF1610 family)
LAFEKVIAEQPRIAVSAFYISCTTCNARLKVRDESAVGEIHTCPRCGSMVMITPPRSHQMASGASDSSHDGLITPANAGAAAGAAPLLSFTFDDAVEMLDPNAPPPSAAPAASRRVDQWADTVDEVASPEVSTAAGESAAPGRASAAPASDHPAALADTVDADEPPGLATSAEIASAPESEIVLEPPPPGEQWLAPSAATWRQWAMLGGAAAAGIGLAVAVFGYAVVSANRSRSAAEAASAVAANDPGEEVKEPAGDDASPATEVDAPAAPETETPGDEPESVGSAEDRGSAEPALPAPADDVSPQQVDAPPEDDSSSEGPPTDAGDSEPESPFEAPDSAPKDDALAGGADLLEQFGGFLGDSEFVSPLPSGVLPTEPENSAPAPGAAPDGSGDASAEVTPLPRPAPREVDVAARLADPIAGLEFTAAPLVDFLEVISDLSTIPITIQPEALRWRRLTPQSPVSVRQSETTVGDALAAALAPLGLGVVADDGHVVITTAFDRNHSLRELKHPVDDLTGGDAERLDELAGLIERFVAPDTWKSAGGPGSATPSEGGLRIEQSEAVHYRVIVFCESLRAARGLASRTKFDTELFQPQAQQNAARKKLATPITLNYRQPTDLRTILDEFGHAAGLTILIDWQAAQEAGWPPGAKGSVVADNAPLRQALTDLLGPMDLAYRIVDGATLEVTTPERLRNRLEPELYPVAELLAGDFTPTSLTERIRNELGADRFEDGRGALHLDPDSKHLIAALPQPQQQELAELLEAWRK